SAGCDPGRLASTASCGYPGGYAKTCPLRERLHRPRRLSEKADGHSGHTGQSIWIDPEEQVYVIVLTNRNHPTMVSGSRKDQQYQARARIGDAALECLGF
ncbi:MAG: serine hydrolase, partial [Thermoguttaceae bacterium]